MRDLKTSEFDKLTSACKEFEQLKYVREFLKSYFGRNVIQILQK